eukprot:s3794_g6.t5
MVRRGTTLGGPEVLYGTAYAQKLIWEHQHPVNCSNASFLLYFHHQAGIGSQLHWLGQALAIAMNLGRVLVISPKDPRVQLYDSSFCPGASGYECWLQNITSCHVGKDVLQIHEHPVLKGRFHDQSVPVVFHEMLANCSPIKSKFWFYWWRSQSVTYLVRFNDRTRKAVDRFRSESLYTCDAHVPSPADILSPGHISAHVRQGEKGLEARLFPLEVYLKQMEALADNSSELRVLFKEVAESDRNFSYPAGTYSERKMFLSTEDQPTVEKALKLCSADPPWHVTWTKVNRSSNHKDPWMHLGSQEAARQEVLIAFTNLELALEADAWVCALSSNWCRLIDELRMTTAMWCHTALVVALLTTWASSFDAPSNLVVVGGFPACGIPQIYSLVESHPNIVTFSIQIGALPNLQTEFAESVFALAKALQVPSDHSLKTVCEQFKSQAPTFRECGRLVNTIRGWYNISMPATLVVTDDSFFDKQMLASRWPGKVKLLFAVREPADFLWTAYNTKTHVRSPELFDELVLADGKKEAWAPRANRITGQWFDQIKKLKDVSANLLFLKQTAYQISGWRPMLCKTRSFIYSKTRDVCEELDSFGVHYGACLGEHDECVDPAPGSITTPLAGSFSRLPAFALKEPGPSNLVVIGGFRTCGTKRIYSLLESHPNIVTLSIQVGALPNLQTEFEESVFSLARALQVPTGRPLKTVCDEFDRQAPTFRECDRLVKKIKGWYNTSMPATLVVTDPSFFDKRMLASRWPGKVKLLLMVREPADFLWAAYNIWALPGEPKEQEGRTGKTHVRSPELFDELVLADGKKEAWAPRANKITGQWFDQIKNLSGVSANLLFLKSEDLAANLTATLARMGSFLGVNAALFPYEVTDGYANSLAARVARTPVYQISGWRPMLCSTRRFIYSKTRDVCEELDSFGVHYSACLGEHDECVDPRKDTNTSAPSNLVIKGWYNTSMPATLVVTDPSFFDQRMLASRWPGKVKMLLMVRESADFLWAAYNIWKLPGEPKGGSQDGSVDVKTHVRSPELFDELVLADGKKEAWAPRANKITGQWFDQIKNLSGVSANLLFLKSEDLAANLNATLLRMGSFFGVNAALFPYEVTDGYTNSLAARVARTPVLLIGKLCGSLRRFIYSKTRDVCEELDSFGVHYSACLGEHDECVDPRKDTNTSAPSNLVMLASRWPGKVKMLLMVREPADFLWAAYNIWKLPGEPKGGSQDGSVDVKTHVRSPELFDEVVSADGKKEAWAPRANKITGQWFDQIKNVKDASTNLLFLKSEDLAVNFTATLARMGSFFGVNAALFPYEVTDGYANSLAVRVARTPLPLSVGLYRISGWRPMLCSTRRFIYSKTRDVCEELDSFGVHYSACLGEHDECVDPRKDTNTSAPSNLVVIGGFRTCGTKRIYSLLESHPNIVTLSIQVGALPNLHMEFEESVFALAKALQVPTDRPLIQVCDEFQFKVPTFTECDRLVKKIKGWYNTSMPATLVVTDPSFFDQRMLASRWPGKVKMLLMMLASRWPGKVKMLLMVREPADFLWAAYNIWKLPGEPKGGSQDGSVDVKTHVRSPELFDELVLADGKKEAWAPRANKITGQWFDQIKYLSGVYRNLLFLKSEDLLDDLRATLARMGSFLRVNASLFPREVTDDYANSLAARVARTPLYQISGWRPMLCSTRRFIYSKTRDVCEELDSFGVHYSACLGEHDECVDPRKDPNSSAPSNLVVIGGFRTCGTQRIYDMLKSHPNIVTISFQVGALPNLHMEFEESIFALAKALQVPTGRPLMQVCDEFQFKVPTFTECDRLVKKIKGWYNTSMPATLVVTDPSFFDQRMLASRWPGKVKMLLMVREPADFLWAAYNIWTLASAVLKLPGEPKGGSQDGSADAKTHVRSPELFDELVLADGKKDAWAPRANKITGQWFDQIKTVKDVSANLLFLKFEDLATLTATARMGSFLGVNASLFAYEVTDVSNSLAARVAQMPLHQISGWRPMLCSTRRFIYSKTRDVCEELDSFGVHYSSCLGEHDDCVDPAPGSSAMPIPNSFPYLPSLPLKESAPSNLVVVGGFRTCGTKRIYDMLESHPNVATLSIQVGALPNLQLEFEESVFALAKALQVPTGRPLIQTCDQYKPHQPQTFKECDRLVNKIRGSYNTSMPATLVVTDPSFFDKGMLASRWPGKVKLLLVVREPADFLWAAYNIWTLASGVLKIHVRSPELFDELVLADGKREAWAPRANKITGQWFDQIKNLKDVSANLLFLKSEDLAKTLSATLAKMGSFFGVDSTLFPYEVTEGYIHSLAARVARTPLYQISGYRPMLCRTRRFIYSKTRDVCEELDSFGVHYSTCLGEIDECVDPAKEANSSAPSNLVVIGGFRTCGTQRIYDMLKSHPNILTISIQVGALPNLQLEFEESVFALAKALQVPTGRPLIQVCDEFQFKVPTFIECERLVNKIRGSYNTSMPATLVVTDPSFFDKGMLVSRWRGKVKKTHVRSPELFDVLVFADGKKDAWAPRANKITGQWFDQIKTVKDVSANLLFLKFEDLVGNLSGTLPKMGSFFGVNVSLFPHEVTDGYINSIASRVARTPLSQISGYRPMLRFIYSKTRDVCEELDSFGVHYSACLGEHDECVDPRKDTNTSAPSNLVVIGGFRTCGTQKIYNILKSHPNIVTISIQVGALPNLQLEFEESVFALAKALQVPTGRPLMQVCDELQFKVPTFIECERLVNRIRGSYDMFMPATLVVTDPSFFDKGMLVSRWRGKVKLLLVVREPADFLWAAYNTWTPQMADGSGLQGLGKNHSPERFDKLVLDGKKEPTKIIGKWFDPIKNLKDVSANLIVLKFEGFSDKSTTNIKKMGAFFGVDPSLFHDEVADGYTSSLAAGVPQTPMYQISGWRPMLCSTRRFIYSKTRDVCEELDSIGVHYSACLGEHDDCVDPPPGLANHDVQWHNSTWCQTGCGFDGRELSESCGNTNFRGGPDVWWDHRPLDEGPVRSERSMTIRTFDCSRANVSLRLWCTALRKIEWGDKNPTSCNS